MRSVNRIITIDKNPGNNNKFTRNYRSLSPAPSQLNKVSSNKSFGIHASNTPRRPSIKPNIIVQPTKAQPAQPVVDGDAELVCTEKELDPKIEEEIKDGFFELK